MTSADYDKGFREGYARAMEYTNGYKEGLQAAQNANTLSRTDAQTLAGIKRDTGNLARAADFTLTHKAIEKGADIILDTAESAVNSFGKALDNILFSWMKK